MPGVHCHPGASCTVAVLLCTLQDCIPTVSQYLYFRPRMSGSKQQWCSWRMLSCSVVSVAQSCPTLHDPVDCSLPGSSVHGILQGRILQWVATSSSRGSFQPRNRTLLLRCSSDYCSLCVCVSVVCILLCMYARSCPTFCDPMGCSQPGSSVHGISQKRTLEWVGVSSSKGSSWPRDQTHVSCDRQILCYCVTWEAQGVIL